MLVLELSLACLAALRFFIPFALRTLTEANTGIIVAQRPAIYIGAALFSLITVLLSIRKPIKIAKRISSITALYYQNETTEIKSNLKSKHFSASGMAWRNIQRTKKKSVLAILSIFLGITACLVVTLLIQSMSTDNFINSAMEHDIELTNQTLVLGYRGGQEQLFDENFITELYSIAGIGDISLQREQTIIPEYSEDMFYPYILDKYQSQGMEAPGVDYYDQYPNRFYTQLVSIDAEKLKDYIVEKGMDYEGFYNGDYGLLAADKPELFPSNQVVRFQCGHISEFEAVAGGDLLELPIGGFLPSSYYGGLSTDAPYIFVSEAAMERISPDAYISWLGIDVNSASEKRVASSVRELCNQAGAISLTSKAELADGLHSAKITLYTLGGGIAFVLAFIGIINFANIMFTNIEARRHELSVMESIGMTKKQICKMLRIEGSIYAGMTGAFIFTLGSAVLYGAFQMVKIQASYAVFAYPLLQIAVSLAVVTVICNLVPVFVYKAETNHSIIQRLRQ